MFNLLVSFPRSGSTFLRHSLELTFSRATIDLMDGKSLVSTNIPAILFKSHHWITHPHVRVIFLLRNPKYCIYSHFKRGNDKKEEKIIEYFEWYNRLIQKFRSSNNDKIIIYYEDLVVDPVYEISKAIEFMKINGKIYIDRLASMDIYNKKQGSIINHGLEKELCEKYFKRNRFTEHYEW